MALISFMLIMVMALGVGVGLPLAGSLSRPG